MSLIDSKKYSLKEVERLFNVPVRKVAFLVRNDLINPVIEGGKLLIPEEELKRYLSLPKKERSKHNASFIKTLGPGIITGASDDDPSGIGTYSTVGSMYGLSLSWLALYLLPMMTAVQETCARIGIVTGKGLSTALSKKYGKKVLYPIVSLLLIANTINIGADISAMVASLQLLMPVNFVVGSILITLFMLLLEIKISYHRYSKVLKWLTLSLLAYILTGFIIQPNWLEVARAISVPHIQINTAFIGAIVAVMGTTISPYLFFWQTSEEVEDQRDKGILSDHHKLAIQAEIRDMRKDTYVGMSLANIVFLFIVITTAFVLHNSGITNIESAADAAAALRPLAGNFAYLLFAIGIIGTGLLAVPVLAGSSAYAIAELFKWSEGLNKKYTKAKGFYGVIIFSMIVGLFLNFLKINPIKALYYAAIVNGLTAPFLLFFIFNVASDKSIMGSFVSPRWVRFWGWIATILMGIGAIALLAFGFLGV